MLYDACYMLHAVSPQVNNNEDNLEDSQLAHWAYQSLSLSSNLAKTLSLIQPTSITTSIATYTEGWPLAGHWIPSF